MTDGINTTYSALSRFSEATRDTYAALADRIFSAEKDEDAILSFLETEAEALQKQLVQVEKLESDIGSKVKDYEYRMEDAQEKYDSWQNEYARNDDDWRFIRARREEAWSFLQMWKEKYMNAVLVQKQTAEKKAELERLLQAITVTKETVEKLSLELRKAMAFFQEEAVYNMHALTATANSTQNYVASVRFSDGVTSVETGVAAVNGAVTLGRKRKHSEPRKFRKTCLMTIRQYLDDNGYGELRPLRRVFSADMPPIREWIRSVAFTMGPEFQDFIQKELQGVIFINTKNNCFFGTRDRGGHRIRIIGLDFSGPDFTRNLWDYVTYHVYLTTLDNQRASLNHAVAQGASRKAGQAGAELEELTKQLAFAPDKPARMLSQGAAFFSTCFSAYAKNDRDTLDRIRKDYADAYRIFSEFTERISHGSGK